MQVTPFLMFTGRAEEAMRLYVSLFPDAEIEAVEHFGPDEAGQQGTVKQARLRIAGQRVKVFDSPPVHDFYFTPSFSFFVDCDDEAQQDRLIAALGDGGRLLMPPGDYGFSRRYAWLDDRFGVSWQLNLG